MRTLVMGGAGSGKSEYAEGLALLHGGRMIYLATMGGAGADAQSRITRHRRLREGKGFVTVVRERGLSSLILPQADTVLLECLGNLAANELFRKGGSPESALREIVNGVESLERQCRHLVVVTNDVFCDGTEYPPETREYLRLLGELNQILAKRFERVAEVVCGIPRLHKGREE